MLSPNTICRKNLLQFLNTNKKNIKGETRKLIFAWRMSNWCPFWAHPPLTQRRQTEKINVKIKNRKSTIRSSHWKCSVRKGVLINFVKFTGKHLCQSLFFNKVAGWGTIFYRIPLMAASISFTARTRFVIFLDKSIYGFTLTLWEDILKNVWETLSLKNFEIWYWQISVDVLSSFS